MKRLIALFCLVLAGIASGAQAGTVVSQGDEDCSRLGGIDWQQYTLTSPEQWTATQVAFGRVFRLAQSYLLAPTKVKLVKLRTLFPSGFVSQLVFAQKNFRRSPGKVTGGYRWKFFEPACSNPSGRTVFTVGLTEDYRYPSNKRFLSTNSYQIRMIGPRITFMALIQGR